MLVRKQILLEESQVLELEKLAQIAGTSVSKMAREALSHGVKVEQKKVNKNIKKIKMSGIKFLTWLTKNPVHGPGDSEYDKYAYDF